MAEEKRSGQEEVSLGIAFVQFYAHKIKYFGSISYSCPAAAHKWIKDFAAFWCHKPDKITHQFHWFDGWMTVPAWKMIARLDTSAFFGTL